MAKSVEVQQCQHRAIFERRQGDAAWPCPHHLCLCLVHALYPAVKITGGILTDLFYYSRNWREDGLVLGWTGIVDAG